MGFNAFETKQAIHKGTVRVKSRVTGDSVADYTIPEGKISHKRIGGKNYVTLPYIKKGINKTLKDPKAKYRHDKDKDSLNRIKVYENLKKKPKRKSTRRGGANIFNFGNNLFNQRRKSIFGR